MAEVTHNVTAAGDHQLGVELDGTFVPLVTVPAERVAQLVDQAEPAAEPAAELEGDGELESEGNEGDAGDQSTDDQTQKEL